MIRFFAKRKAKKGFTLVETIVVIALIGLIMACVVTFSGPVRAMMKNTTAKADAITINKIIANYIERRLAYANYINVYPRVNASSLNSDLLSAGNDLRLHYTLSQNTRGIMIFKYEESSDPAYKSTYRIYDGVIKDAPGLALPQQNLPADILANLDPSASNHDHDQVFIDEFYSDYEFFIAPTLQVDVNRFKKKAYLKFEITSFNFSDDYGSRNFSLNDNYGIDKETINKYYDPALADGVREIASMPMERTGTHNVTFGLENIKTFGDTIQNGTVQFQDVSSYSAGCAGSDIVIFYSIPKK
jgi:prepilin-type N-terminal cleavage/methylation domain-containing protein